MRCEGIVKKEVEWKNMLFLHFLFFLYSLFSVLSKIGGRMELLSLPFFLCYGGAFFVLGLYAVGWQQILKRMPLFLAYSGKAVVVIWGILWGALLFHETISVRKIIGAGIIMSGIVLYSRAEVEKPQ